MDKKKRHIELLVPARTADIGIEAVLHGADAVYIGACDFGARAAAGNSCDDIRRLCTFAHQYGAKVYVTLNTILYDDELEAAKRLVEDLYDAGTDALIVQDTALLRLDLPPIELHASTQMDITTPERARMLYDSGFEQIVLARELSLDEIGEIHRLVPARLEAFVHGALCVSYSGRCYASEHCFGRSANRGRCAQFCRLAFDLVDADGNTIVEDKHLLSLRDMNRSDYIEEMMDAGISSFKIEGRLKGADYVKNLTAFYRKRIDEVLSRRSEDYVRSSYGHSNVSFEPNPAKSFNRGFTNYFLKGRTQMLSPHTPKSIGESVGRIVAKGRRSFSLRTSVEIHAGDGLCYIDGEGKMQGLRVNRVEADEIFPAKMPHMAVGTEVFRNLDYAFTHALEKPTATRRMKLDIALRETPGGYSLCLSDEAGRRTTLNVEEPKQDARTPQRDNIVRQMSRLGDTPYELRNISIETEGEKFIPSSRLAEWRRTAIEALLREPIRDCEHERKPTREQTDLPKLSTQHLDYTFNVSNKEARAFYEECGAKEIEPAYELQHKPGATLMTCRHCIRYAFGMCHKQAKGGERWNEPVALRLPNGRTFPLEFDCARCEMKVNSQ